MTRTIFLGTPDAAVPTLRELAASTEVEMVVTQPDRPQGRSSQPVPPPIKEAAIELGIEVRQPDSPAELLTDLLAHPSVDVGIVVAYGRILTTEMLAVPVNGMLNVHFSLLPRWRGAAPVARALMSGDMMTGVTIIRLDEGLDTGPVLTAQAVDIHQGENAGALTTRLAQLGARLLTSSLPEFLSGKLDPVPQSDEGSTYASKVGPSDRALTKEMTAETFLNRVRGLSPLPGAVLILDGVDHKILSAAGTATSAPPGRWVEIDGGLVVGLSDGSVAITHIQPAGRREMTGAEWLRGRKRNTGDAG